MLKSLIGLLKEEDALVKRYNDNERLIEKSKKYKGVDTDYMIKENKNILDQLKEIRKTIHKKITLPRY